MNKIIKQISNIKLKKKTIIKKIMKKHIIKYI